MKKTLEGHTADFYRLPGRGQREEEDERGWVHQENKNRKDCTKNAQHDSVYDPHVKSPRERG